MKNWRLFVLATFGCFATLVSLPDDTVQQPRLTSSALAGAGISEKEAFESAKELGTIEAWEAFLNRFSTGFRADLARAYVKRLGSRAQPTQPKAGAAPSRPTKKANASPALSTYHARPGDAAWRTTRYNPTEGGGLQPAASVAADGVELVLYCNRSKRIGAVVRESGRERYPQFDARIRQGLDAIRRGRDQAYVPIEFSDGSQYPVSADLNDGTGEMRLGYLAKEGGFRPDGDVISNMMSAAAINIAAPPFSATLQLTNSRKAICSMTKSCGVTATGCPSAQKYVAPQKKKKSYKKRTKKRACKATGGRCKRNSQCCGGKCCLDDFEECEGWYGKCA